MIACAHTLTPMLFAIRCRSLRASFSSCSARSDMLGMMHSSLKTVKLANYYKMDVVEREAVFCYLCLKYCIDVL